MGRQRVKEGRGIKENRGQESRERTRSVDVKEGGVEINEKENGIEKNRDVLTFYMEREVRGEGG